MRLNIWNVRSLYSSGSLTRVARELARYEVDLVVVHVVRWEKVGAVRAGDYIFSMEKEMRIINWEQDFFVHHRIVSAVKTVR